MAKEWHPQEPEALVGYVIDVVDWAWDDPSKWIILKRPEGGTLTAAEINTIRLNHTPDPIRQTAEQVHLARALGRIPGMTATESDVLHDYFNIPDTPPLLPPSQDAAGTQDKDAESAINKLVALAPTLTAKEIAALKARLGARS